MGPSIHLGRCEGSTSNPIIRLARLRHRTCHRLTLGGCTRDGRPKDWREKSLSFPAIQVLALATGVVVMVWRFRLKVSECQGEEAAAMKSRSAGSVPRCWLQQMAPLVSSEIRRSEARSFQ